VIECKDLKKTNLKTNMKIQTKAYVMQSQNKTAAYICLIALATVLSALALAPLVHAEDIIPVKNSVHAAADTKAPSDVENVKATAGNGYVDLSWNVATDDTAVKGYKIYYGTNPVSSDGQAYTLGPIDAGNKITYRVEGLTNGTTYYFAVTAYDESGNESENYSSEASATPAHASADTEAPKVVRAEATSKSTVKVVFSEAVQLPSVTPESAFSIKSDSTQAALTVTKAEIDSTDFTKKTIKLTTANQDGSLNYIVTAGIQVTDASGNPIISGTSDSALFKGSSLAAVVETQQTVAQADTTPPSLAGVTDNDSTHVLVTFSEPVKLAADPTQNFIITEEAAIENTLNILSVSLSPDGKTALLTTAAQKAINYNLIVVDVKDLAGNLISVDNNATVFSGGFGITTQETQSATQETQFGTQEAVDKTPPEDSTSLTASLVGKAIAHLVWAASLNSAGDLANYILYKGTDGKTYGPGDIIDAAALSSDVNELIPGMKYFFKLTARDANGNESKGIVTSFTLPSTGPELGLLLASSLGLGKVLCRKKKSSKKIVK
jgi:hypothetical protein